tara:strand:- start:40 stop:408 length:369 start_codon:yes stop_codon:yes gene_type:complete
METNILDKNTNDRKKIALLLSGNLRSFYNEKFNIYKKYSELLIEYDIDVFVYVDNNDFYYEGSQYISSKNKKFEIITGNNPKSVKRILDNIKKIDYSNKLDDNTVKLIYSSKLQPNRKDYKY